MKYGIKKTTYEYNNHRRDWLTDPAGDRLEFDSVQGAVEYITAPDDGWGGLHATLNADGVTFSPEMRELPHNCYSAPDYEIVNLSTGRSSQSIRAAIRETQLATA